ncbi:mannose-1-phosphate guanylyltransferase/mannose-6-phosphate isomerase [Rhodobacteraceae bacterium NNCM2]|nr:mannose-1-phosphate guanylyltransferase/mannose-6-phosphate isomerase [Coraliihabitans acroporae]
MTRPLITPVILCGGSGTRLWPLSRKTYPKQFSQLFEGETLFQRTLSRVRGEGFAKPILLTHEDFRFIAAEQLGAAGFEAERIVVEPDGRNTAPATCLAALILAEIDPDGIMLVLASDHVMTDDSAFHAAVEAAVEAANAGALVTFGITPDRPETGYGYIEIDGPPQPGAQPFVRFVEKPDLARAEEMVASGRYLWNSGTFLFRASHIIDAFEAYAPDVLKAAREAKEAGRNDLDFFRPGTEEYLYAPDISIDYAVMERVAGQVVPVDCGWNDLGSWKTVWQESAADQNGTVAGQGTISIDCRQSLLRSEEPGIRLVGLGLDNIIAIATRDAVLVANMDRAQDVRLAVEALKAEGASQATEFPRCYRPWGWYETLALGGRFQVKQIMVKPGGQLSLQSHVHRSEHWVVVSGTARVTVDEEVKLMTENESVYIPLGAVHRLENPGKVELHLIEVQSGPYLGEDDIVRYEDVYARV